MAMLIHVQPNIWNLLKLGFPNSRSISPNGGLTSWVSSEASSITVSALGYLSEEIRLLPNGVTKEIPVNASRARGGGPGIASVTSPNILIRYIENKTNIERIVHKKNWKTDKLGSMSFDRTISQNFDELIGLVFFRNLDIIRHAA